MDKSPFTPQHTKEINPIIFNTAREAASVAEMRIALSDLTYQMELEASRETANQGADTLARIRDCAQVFRNMLKKRSDQMASFSMAQAIWDMAHDHHRPDLSPGFYADLQHILLGLQGKGSRKAFDDMHLFPTGHLAGRPAALERSSQMDTLLEEVDRYIGRYETGYCDQAVSRRQKRQEHICNIMGATPEQWHDWRWQVKNVIKDVDLLDRLVVLSSEQKKAVTAARHNNLPFGVTPYYLSLMDDEQSGRDAAIRAQVLPPMDYVEQVSATRGSSDLDFMGEEDTSPFDLITRRYPAICILKPFNTCPQICVYCQRNWEIDDAMASGAFAGTSQIDAAIDWIRQHPSIHEVLITGGDPLAMGDAAIEDILEKVAAIPSIDRIRIGSRTPITVPMRITDKLAKILGRFRIPGRREVAITTHVQHPYELTPDVFEAVSRLRLQGLGVYNQLVYTFYASKRFEASALRRHLRLAGIDPYYTFNTKGKDETLAYRVPIARLIQEQQEEARLLPGLERTDEAVFNVPRLGKNYLKSREHRDLLSILPNGARVYEFYSWEKNIGKSTQTYSSVDVPILDYLVRLEKSGENIKDYETIWYYF